MPGVRLNPAVEAALIALPAKLDALTLAIARFTADPEQDAQFAALSAELAAKTEQLRAALDPTQSPGPTP